MRRDFEKAGNDAGLAWIDKLIPVAEAKVRLDDVKQKMDDLLAEQQRAESSVNVQQDAGVINEMDARQRILDIHRATYEAPADSADPGTDGPPAWRGRPSCCRIARPAGS